MLSIFQSALTSNSLRMKGKAERGTVSKTETNRDTLIHHYESSQLLLTRKNIYMLSGVFSVLITIDISLQIASMAIFSKVKIWKFSLLLIYSL